MQGWFAKRKRNGYYSKSVAAEGPFFLANSLANIFESVVLKVATREKNQTLTLRSDRRRWTGWPLDGLVLLFFVIVTVFMTWPVTPNMGRSLEHWGDALLQTWTLDWDVYAFMSDPLHFANANAFYPYQNSLAFSETLVGQALLVAPVIWLTGNPVLGYNLLLLSSFALCGWGMYLLGRDLTGSRLAGLAAGMIFGFFPHRFGQLSHLHLLTAQWMPLALLFLRRYLRNQAASLTTDTGPEIGQEATGWPLAGRPSRATIINLTLFGLFLTLELLSSTYLGLFLVVTVGLYLAYYLLGWLLSVRRGQVAFKLRPNKATTLAMVLVVCGLVVLPFYWPYLSVQQDLGFQRSASEVQNYSAQPYYYLDVPKENRLNRLVYRQVFQQDWWQSSAGGERGLFLGLGAIGLGLLGLVVVWRNRKSEGLFFVVLAGLAISFTFGPTWQTGRFGAIPLPYAFLYNYVPGFGAIRVPVRFIYVVALAVSALAAFGVAASQRRFRLTGWPRVIPAAILIVLLLGGEYWSEVDLQLSDTLRNPAPPTAKWLDAHPAPSLHLPLSGTENSNLLLQYWTRASWRPVMNGFSGFMPPAYDALKVAVAGEGFSPRIIELLQGLEVRYLDIESDESSIKGQWPRLKGDLEKAGAAEVARFGNNFIYELKADPWLRNLQQFGLGSQSLVYFVEYRRTASPLLELTASFLQSSGVIKSENLAGSLSVGFRPLPPLPTGRPADFLVIAASEDPTLYGFLDADRIFGNNLLAVYKKNPNLLSRYDFTRQAASGMINRDRPLAIIPDGNKLKFAEGRSGGSSGSNRVLGMGLAVLQPQKLQVQIQGGATQTYDLQPGLSRFDVPLEGGVTLSGGQFSLAWAELRQPGTANRISAGPVLRSDVLLLSSGAYLEDGRAVASIGIVGPGQPNSNDYTATLDIYNTPWGSHPSGHYGYWSLPVPSGSVAQTEWRLDLTHKTLTTRFNGQPVPNYPPDPAQFDFTQYGKLGDFRANLNLYAGPKLVGSTKLFDFTVWSQGDKNQVENRHANSFKGYNNPIEFLVLPPLK